MDIIFHSLSSDELKALIKDSILEVLDQATLTHPQQPEQPDELLRINQVCSLLNVSKVTIHNWKREGKIPFYRISNKIFFKKSEVISSLKKAKKGL